MDFITNVPKVVSTTNAGTLKYNGIFTIVNRITKLVRLVPVYFRESQLTEETAGLFFDHFVHFYGVPKLVIHDHDPCFTSAFWGALWNILGSRAIASSSYHPQTDGQSQPTHRTLEKIIRAYIFESNSDLIWVEVLPFMEFAINSTKSDTTNTSPFEIVYGQLPAALVDRITGVSEVPTSSTIVADRKAAVKAAQQQIARSQQWQKTCYDAHYT